MPTTTPAGPRSAELDDLDKAIESHPIWTELRGPLSGDNYLFFRQGSDVVVTQPDGSFVTILKGGENNGWFQGATPR